MTSCANVTGKASTGPGITGPGGVTVQLLQHSTGQTGNRMVSVSQLK